MICQRCGREEAEWRCSVCEKIVCTDCAKTEKNKVYCLDDIPTVSRDKKEPLKPEKTEKGKSLKMMFYTLLVLTIGMGGIYYITEKFIAEMNVPAVAGAITAIESSALLILYGMIGLTVLPGLGYLAARRL